VPARTRHTRPPAPRMRSPAAVQLKHGPHAGQVVHVVQHRVEATLDLRAAEPSHTRGRGRPRQVRRGQWLVVAQAQLDVLLLPGGGTIGPRSSRGFRVQKPFQATLYSRSAHPYTRARSHRLQNLAWEVARRDAHAPRARVHRRGQVVQRVARVVDKARRRVQAWVQSRRPRHGQLDQLAPVVVVAAEAAERKVACRTGWQRCTLSWGSGVRTDQARWPAWKECPLPCAQGTHRPAPTPPA
jgi:hypothetical protein